LYPRTLAYRLHTSWLDAAIVDPCSFHAVFFGTSSSIDITQGAPASPITLYHKTQTIRWVQRAITECNSKDIPASAVAATLYLFYHTVGLAQLIHSVEASAWRFRSELINRL
jgi:hypothetical protein